MGASGESRFGRLKVEGGFGHSKVQIKVEFVTSVFAPGTTQGKV